MSTMSDGLPVIEFLNLFESDPIGQKLWKHYLGSSVYQELHPRYLEMGRIGALATPLSRMADRETPRINEMGVIEYHPSYLELQRLSYGEGIVALKYDPQFLKAHQNNRHLIAFSIAYYFAQTETGLFCPICMTDALGRVLEKNKSSSPQAEVVLQHIASKNLNELWQGAMFLTEKQGGSDVGANRVQAKNLKGKWRLSGEKWFCSNADAEAALVLARMPDSAKGTKGLGLFLLLRNTPNENFKNIKYKRLKDKLGVRSMASAEIDLLDAEAFLIGGEGEGFKMMTEMVNMSRLYNSVASIAVARRALLEASEFGKQRFAFGESLANLNLWRKSLSDLSAEVFGMQVFIFEAIRLLDKFDNGDTGAGNLLRIMTPIAKGLSGKLAVYACRESMELIGGNAFIEDHILPRLLRDALVLPIWEGTTNIQSLDLLRAIKKEGVQVLEDRLEQCLQSKGSERLKKNLQKNIFEFKAFLKNEASESAGENVDENAIDMLLKMGRVLTLAFVFELSANPDLRDFAEAVFERLYERGEMFQTLATGKKSTEAVERMLMNI